MSGTSTDLVAVREARERAIARLSDHFAHDLLDVDEFEQRLDRAHRASTVAEIDQLLGDLPVAPEPPPGEALALRRPTALRLSIAERVPEGRKIVAVLSGAQREGQWIMPRRLRVVAVLGGIQLDFREAIFAPGVSEVSLVSVLGGAEIILPPGLSVEMEGSSVLGGVDHMDRFPTAACDPDAPLLRIHGTAILGGVHVETRLPGETERDSRRRVRAERRQQRRELRERRRRELPKAT